MKTFSKTKLSVAIAALTAGSLAIAATTDGTLGANSTGTVDVTMSVNDLVRITGLDDITLTDPGQDGVFDGSDAFCVGTNAASLDYRVTLTMGTESDFTLTGNATADADFTPSWDDGSGATTGFVEASELATDFTTTSNDIDAVCNTPNTTLALVTENVNGFDSTSYAETITVLITPQ